ncbi:MAG: response regulator [Methylibium sp.]|uniref:sensor histidine kinase n=1 Tax=Methylibium sp. TaxID=2067992 RepID=UPI0017F95842|nr:ATP-binding protein [Methylibium sp.]MBA3597725.1 response regulator [Methylibium sp.]
MNATQNRARLLIVDDQAIQLRVICETLTHEGYDTTCCRSAEEALAHLQGEPYDVLISDLCMPGTDGISLIEQARKIDPDLVPVVMTGHGSIPTAVQAMKLGAIDYLLKPLRLADMRPVLIRAMELRRLRREKQVQRQRILERGAQLEATNRELEAFAARVAHDLREPVNIVLGFGRMLAERGDPPLDTQANTYLGYILQAADRANRLVHDMLAFARLGNSPLTLTAVDLNLSVRQARHMVTLSNPYLEAEWVIPSLPTVAGDASLLQQVFVNLLSNAFKYSVPKGRPRIEIAHWIDAQGGHVIAVRDNGVGFNPAQTDRLFMPFQRLHRADQFAGNGMGLANVKRIVERHGGSVRAEAKLGEGAVITLSLPVDAKDGAPLAPAVTDTIATIVTDDHWLAPDPRSP